MGASLLMMVAGLTKSKTNAEAEKIALAEARAALVSVRERLATLADTDADAFDQVMAAYRLPKGTDDEKNARKDAIQRALRAATEAPLDTLRAMVEAMRHARVVAEHGNRSAASDVRVAVELLEAAAVGAAANVQINLEGIADDDFKRSAAGDATELAGHLKADALEARARVLT